MKFKSILPATLLLLFSYSLTAQTVREVISTPTATHRISRTKDIAMADDETKPFTGKFIVLNEDKEKTEESNYVNGKLEGKFMEWRKNFRDTPYVSIEAFYKNDKLHGHYIERSSPGMKRKECDYVNGELDGQWISYSGHKEDEVDVIRFYKSGKFDSTSTWFYEGGKPQRIERYKNGKEEGLFQEFYADGTVKRVINYVNGLKHGQDKYYEKGQLLQVANYVNGKKDGDEVLYYENGKVKEKRSFKMDSKVGKWTWYNEDGSVKEETTYQL